MKEADFQDRCLRRLRALPGTYWFKLNDKTTIGMPDIVGSINGQFVAIELKTKTKVSKIQQYTLDKIEAAGGLAYVVKPENFDHVFISLSAASWALQKKTNEVE